RGVRANGAGMAGRAEGCSGICETGRYIRKNTCGDRVVRRIDRRPGSFSCCPAELEVVFLSDENAVGLYGKIEPARKPADQEIGGNAVSLEQAQGAGEQEK